MARGPAGQRGCDIVKFSEPLLDVVDCRVPLSHAMWRSCCAHRTLCNVLPDNMTCTCTCGVDDDAGTTRGRCVSGPRRASCRRHFAQAAVTRGGRAVHARQRGRSSR
eukprot:5510260-Prymnesium_polylepis.1